MSLKRVSQRDVARRAEVHFTTVSLALRNSPALPEATRRRIQHLAEEMGYRPDPMLSALQVYRKNAKSPRFGGTFAWLNNYKDPNVLYKSKFTRIYFDSARERCEELGYRLEEFHIANTSRARTSGIFRARNIQGLLLPPQPHNRTHINFDWENYSAVSFGYSLSYPRLHSVANAQYSSSRLAVRVLRKYGHRRIGFVTTHNIDERTDQNFSSGFLAEQRRLHPSDRIPMLVMTDSDDHPTQRRVLSQWYNEYRPTVISTLYNTIALYMETLKIPYSKCGLAFLGIFESDGKKFAGIDQNERVIGRTAVDFLVGMIHRNERGIPETPLRILIDGRWTDGSTVHRLNAVRTLKKLLTK